MFEGDCVLPELWSSGNHKAMPTAIIEGYTSEGFAVIADGLSTNAQKVPLRKSNQKIFPLNNYARSLAYVLYGTTRITARLDSYLALDLSLEAQKTAVELADYDPRELSDYAKEFCGRLQKNLANCKDKIDYPCGSPEPEHPERCLILWVLFSGYYRGLPTRADVKITHRNRSLGLDPSNSRAEFGYRILGSAKIAEALLTRERFDPRLTEYRTPAMEKEQKDLTLDEVIGIGTSYIHACESKTGREIDPEIAPTIGGDIHAVTITAKDGATWARGYGLRENLLGF
jgi:hypothetical protein